MNNSVTLRPLELEDVELLYSVENDPTQWHISSTTMPFSREFLRQYIITTTGDVYADRQLRLVIADETDSPIGLADLTSFDPKNLRAEIGLTLLPSARGCGLSHLAIDALKKYARSTLHLHQLYAIVPADNVPSLRMLRKCDFTEGITLSDWLFDGEKYHEAVLLQVKL